MKINRNIFWTINFFDRLAGCGIKHICISPGSRSTALTLAAASNKKFKCFVHIDERSSGYFALGIAKATGKPVIIITTSGTAVAELYPSIVEAYQQRLPLIVCTADRPPELLGHGANQTINQDNIYKNHIRFFKNAGLPSATISGIKKIRKIAEKAYRESNKGPVHINFPFRKPFEPDSFTDNINNKTLKLIEETKSIEIHLNKNEERYDSGLFKEILNSLSIAKKGLIIAGPIQYTDKVNPDLIRLSEKLHFPVLADASSQLRFGRKSLENLIINYEGFLKNKYFIGKFAPDLILQFGSTPSSKAIETYLAHINPKRYIINEHGDLFDPWNTASGVFKCDPSLFCKSIIKSLPVKIEPYNTSWLNALSKADNLSGKIKDKIISDSSFPNECRVLPEIINNLPGNTHLIVSNSMPVRDFDYFSPASEKKINVHTNRGASGIDGIISTSLGIRKAVQRPALLLTGDLAFFYDLGALLIADKYKIPLVIVLINNNGGGIFSMLPVAKYGKKFSEFFTSPHNLNFESIVKSFNGRYKSVKSWNDLKKSMNIAFDKDTFTVLEIKTDIQSSVNLRKKYFREADKIISKNFS